MFSPLKLAILGGVLVGAQFIPPPAASTFTTVNGPQGIQVRYKKVRTGPGSICELNSNVISYSGFVDVSEHEHIFFWFFGAREIKPEDAPLTAWISGGPGDSSMSELFTEHGPCRLNENLEVINNPYSWNGRSNMVYIDQPTTVGFSYTDAVPAYINSNTCEIETLSTQHCPKSAGGPNGDNCENYGPAGPCGTFPDPESKYTANSTETAAPVFYKALQGIYAAFPNYTQHNFTLGSESYGGHYAPVFSRYIAEQNANLSGGAVKIPQTSLIVNNGWFDPAVAYASFYNFLVKPGNTYDITINKTEQDKMYNKLYGKGQCLDRLAVCNNASTGNDKNCKSADDYCTSAVQNIYDNVLGRDEYDVREIDPSPFPNSYYVTYLNTLPVMQELAVFTNYTDESQIVSDLFEDTGDDGKELGITQALADLLDRGVSVTLWHGDADYDCNWFNGQTMVQHIAEKSKTNGLTQAYASAGFQNVSTSDGVVHGQVKQAGLLTFMRVYQSGHQDSFFTPITGQAVHYRTISGLDIATGTINVKGMPLYTSTGPANSTYREGMRTVQDQVLPYNAVYNTTTNEPNPIS